MRRILLCVIVYSLLAVPCWCAGTYTGDISELIDFGKLAYLQDSTCTQFSSYDRTGGNDDGFSGKSSFIRKEGYEYVIFDYDGPGCINRIWSANPNEKRIEFYFDGSDKPGLVFDNWQDMYQDKAFPFMKPLSQHFIGGWCSYVPIPFAKHCKIIAHGDMNFIQITWQKFTSAKGVKTFSTNYSDDYKAKFETVKKVWSNPGTAPWGDAIPAKWKTYNFDVTVKPGANANLFELKGAGVVRAFYVTAASTDPQYYRKCTLEVTTDNQAKPNIWSPIGDFFLDGFGWPAGKSAITGKIDGRYYSYWPMPYANGLQATMANDSSSDLVLHCTAIVEPMKSLPKDMGRFYAWWHRENPVAIGKGFEILTATGRGQYCGVNHYMQGPRAELTFLEGDEMMWIDDRDNTSYNGTGTEDYFNGGWYFGSTGCAPLYGCGVFGESGGTIDAYRFQIPDMVPFQKKAHIEIESGPGNDYPADYAGVTYWYGEPGMSHTFDKSAADNRLLSPRRDQYPNEAEHGFFNGGPDVELKSSQEPSLRFSGDRAVACYSKEPGAWMKCVFNFEATASYLIRAQVACGPEYGKVAAFIGDKQIGEVDCYAPQTALRMVTFAKNTPEISAGEHKVTFRVTGKSDKATACNVIVDTVYITRADLVEAETMKLLSNVGGKAEIQLMGSYGGQWSNDAQVLMTNDNKQNGKGSSYEFEMPVVKTGKYYFDFYFTKGPDFGVVKLTADGKEIERDVDLYNDKLQRAPMMRFGNEIDLTAGMHTIKVEITGKTDRSIGYLVGLDAIGLEPASGN